MSGYQAITLAELRARLQQYTEQTPFWTDAEADLAINEALRTWNMLTGRWHDRIVLETPPTGNADYALPNAILYRTRVLFNGSPLDGTSYEALMSAHPRWRVETTATGGDIPTRPRVWCPISLRTILIWPADAAGHNSLTIDGVANTPVLVADGDFVNLAEADVSVLLPFALHVLSFKKGGQWFSATAPAFANFLRAASEENQLLTTAQAYRRWAGLYKRDENPLREVVVPAGVHSEATP